MLRIADNEPGYATMRTSSELVRIVPKQCAKINPQMSALLSAEDAPKRSGGAPQRIAGVRRSRGFKRVNHFIIFALLFYMILNSYLLWNHFIMIELGL
jgi:hypothetical protein